METLLIINGIVVNADASRKAGVAVSNASIIEVGSINPKAYPGAAIIDAKGKYVLPGGIDPHVHFALPTSAGNSSDDFASGSRAAIAGGTTTFIDFVTPRRGQTLQDALDQRKAEAAGSLIDYKFHLGISEWNSDIASELEACFEKEKITSVKTYVAYRESIGISYDELEQVMEIAASAGKLVLVHCEDGEIIARKRDELLRLGKTRPCYHAASRPPEAEIRAVEKVIGLSAKTGCSVYIVHTSTAEAADAIASAKRSGLPVFAETCPQYLVLDEAVYDEGLDDYKVLPYVLSPPVRSAFDRERLWEGLSDGTFDTVATDHCPFNLYGQKDQGIDDFTKIPNGAGGIEHRFSLLYTFGVSEGRFNLNQFVKLVSARPAELFGMADRKGGIEKGYDADIVIWDPDAQGRISAEHHFQRCDTDIYEGFQIRGKPELVIVNGRIAFRNGKFENIDLKGRYLPDLNTVR
ncbi:MAG: dihydropyrimidinase [Bacteroidetes bacterium]|nr:dihydropyrimidinase [Bacteroidota bacterium]